MVKPNVNPFRAAQIKCVKAYSTYKFYVGVGEQTVKLDGSPSLSVEGYGSRVESFTSADAIAKFLPTPRTNSYGNHCELWVVDELGMHSDGMYVEVKIEGVDGFRKTIYSMSEGEISVGSLYDGKVTETLAYDNHKYITSDNGLLADYLITLLLPLVTKARGLKSPARIPHNKSNLVTEDKYIQWRWATKEEENDPSIKWVMEGHSKYGRRMVCKERGLIRGLSMMEFYGGGIVD